MAAICKDKDSQRAIALEARRKLSFDQREMFSSKIAERLRSILFSDTHTVLAYAATCDEVDLSYFVKESGFPDIRFAFPVSYKGGIMKAYVPSSDDAWENGKFGIRAPKEELSERIDPKDIDIVLVPCVAFDEKCRRLGHGGGYYDRYLPLCKNARFVCVAFEAQKLDNIITDAFDTPMDCVVTEDRIYWPEQRKARKVPADGKLLPDEGLPAVPLLASAATKEENVLLRGT